MKQPFTLTVRAYTPTPDILNEWVVETQERKNVWIRRARYMGKDAAFYAARCANEWRRTLNITKPRRTK